MTKFRIFAEILGCLIDILAHLTAALAFFIGVITMCRRGQIAEGMALMGGIMILFCKIDHEFRKRDR